MKTLSLPVVRTARFSDIKALVSLFEEAHAEFGRAPFCPETTRNTMQRAINQRNAGVFLLVCSGEVAGALVAVVNQLWYSRTKQVADLIYYVRPSDRGHGRKLLTAYLGWAKEQKNVGEIMLGITSGAGKEKQTRKFLKHFSMLPVGSNYRLIEEENNVECSEENR